MAHYFMQDSQTKMAEEFAKFTEDEVSEVKNQLIIILDYIVEGKMTKVSLESAVAQEHLTENDPIPVTVTLRDSSGLSVKTMNDTFYLGTNGDWIEFSTIYDFLGVDWKSYFED